MSDAPQRLADGVYFAILISLRCDQPRLMNKKIAIRFRRSGPVLAAYGLGSRSTLSLSSRNRAVLASLA
jgi:hypothetical protein